MAFLGDLWRIGRAARAFGRGARLERRGRLAEAREALQAARGHVAAEAGSRALEPARFSARLSATALLATVAARTGEAELARDAAREGLGLWAAARIQAPRVRDLPAMAEWADWARRYLAGGG